MTEKGGICRVKKGGHAEREKKSESINHSNAPVRVASGTNRNRMGLDNNPNVGLALKAKKSPPFFPSPPTTPCILSPER